MKKNPSINTSVVQFSDDNGQRDYVEDLPGNRGSFLTTDFRERIEKEVANQFAAGQKATPPSQPA